MLNRRFTLAAFVNNVENNAIVGFSSPHPRAGSLLIETLRPPRTFGVRLGVTY